MLFFSLSANVVTSFFFFFTHHGEISSFFFALFSYEIEATLPLFALATGKRSHFPPGRLLP